VHLLELAAEGMEGRGVMHCHRGQTFDPQCTSAKADKTGGRCFVVNTHPESGRKFVCDPADMSRKLGNAHVEIDLIDFMVDLQDQVNMDIPKLKSLTLHRHNGMIFRVSASFHSSVWRDWVVEDWGRGFEKMPGCTWGFQGSTLVGSTISN